jgi:ATP-binding cassette subfamily F protein 3
VLAELLGGCTDETEVRTKLGTFSIRGEEVLKLVGALSHGERGKVLLAKLILSPSNLLVLDEPSNHLDIVSRESLERALIGYQETVVIASHDRYLIRALCTRCLWMADGSMVETEVEEATS